MKEKKKFSQIGFKTGMIENIDLLENKRSKGFFLLFGINIGFEAQGVLQSR